MTQDQTSLSLLRRLRDDASDDWARFTRIYQPLIAGWGRKFELQETDIEDLVQETLTTVRRRIDSFSKKVAGQSFRAWLYVIARNKAIDLIRKKAKQPVAAGGSSAQQRMSQLAEQEPADWSRDAMSDHALLTRGLECVQAEFEAKTWQAFWLSKVDDLPTATVAEQLGMSTNAVRKARFRVTHRLQDEFAGLMTEFFDG